MAMLSLILDLLLVALLGVTIFYVFRLNTQIRILQKSRSEIEKLVHEFGSIVTRAEAGVNGLRLAAEESGYGLQKQIERATALKEEMHFMIETADQLANKITHLASAARAEPRPAMEPTQRAPAPASESERPRSRAEQELLQALQRKS